MYFVQLWVQLKDFTMDMFIVLVDMYSFITEKLAHLLLTIFLERDEFCSGKSFNFLKRLKIFLKGLL